MLSHEPLQSYGASDADEPWTLTRQRVVDKIFVALLLYLEAGFLMTVNINGTTYTLLSHEAVRQAHDGHIQIMLDSRNWLNLFDQSLNLLADALCVLSPARHDKIIRERVRTRQDVPDNVLSEIFSRPTIRR